MAGDPKVVIQHTMAALAEAHLLDGTTNPLDEVAQLKLDLAARTKERDDALTANSALTTKLAQVDALVDELTTTDAAEDAKRQQLKALTQQQP